MICTLFRISVLHALIKSLLKEKKENEIISYSRETLREAIDVDERLKLYSELLLLSFGEYELK